MKKHIPIFIVVILFLFIQSIGSEGLDIRMKWGLFSINIFEGNEFNGYPMNFFSVLAVNKTENSKFSAGPYFFFNDNEEYYEHGFSIFYKTENDQMKLKLAPFYVSFTKPGDKKSGVIFWGEFTYKTNIVDMKVAYTSNHMIDASEINGNVYRFSLEKGFPVNGFGVVIPEISLIYNNGFFETGPGRFIYSAAIIVEDIKTRLFNAEIFAIYAYSEDVISKLMVGFKLDFSLVGKGNQ